MRLQLDSHRRVSVPAGLAGRGQGYEPAALGTKPRAAAVADADPAENKSRQSDDYQLMANDHFHGHYHGLPNRPNQSRPFL